MGGPQFKVENLKDAQVITTGDQSMKLSAVALVKFASYCRQELVVADPRKSAARIAGFSDCLIHLSLATSADISTMLDNLIEEVRRQMKGPG